MIIGCELSCAVHKELSNALSTTTSTHQLSQHSHKLQMQLRKEPVISHHLRQASRSHPRGPILSRIAIRIRRPPGQERRYRDAVLPPPGTIITAVSLILFNLLRSPRYDVACNAPEMLPDECHDLIRSGLAAGECYEGVLAVTTAGIRVREAEFVRYGPAV